MDSADYLRRCKVLNIADAAMMLACRDVSEMVSGIENLSPEQRPMKYEAAKTAIIDALLRGALDGKMRAAGPDGAMGSAAHLSKQWIEEPGHVDPINSTVDMASLKQWASGQGDTKNLLFGESRDTPGYLDPTNTHYSPKLAAAVKVWFAFENEKATSKSLKKRMEKWLHERAIDLRLQYRGAVTKQGIEHVAEIANWEPEGGAPTTRKD